MRLTLPVFLRLSHSYHFQLACTRSTTARNTSGIFNFRLRSRRRTLTQGRARRSPVLAREALYARHER
ncbi:MAG: hypothetical protein KKB70_09395 [Proteobacteria bacterium]|nr:hypothetical protein [Pseudomonadota bacterium]